MVGPVKNQRGGISVFQCILFTALLILAGILVDAVRIMAAERKVQSALNTSLRSVLAGYDKDLTGGYGLFGRETVSEKDGLKAEFIRYLKVNVEENNPGFRFSKFEIDEDATQVEGFGNMFDNAVYKEQILQYMKYKAPITVTRGIVDKFTASGLFRKLRFAEKEKAVRDTRNEIKGRVDDTNETVKEANGKGTMDLGQLKDTKSKLEEALKTISQVNLSLETTYKDAGNEVKKVLEEKEEWEVDPEGEKIENPENSEFNSVKIDGERLGMQIEVNIQKLDEIIGQVEALEKQISSLQSEISSLQSQLDDTENESTKQNIRERISSLRSRISDLEAQIRSLEEGFRPVKMDEIRLQDLHNDHEAAEKPVNNGQKEEVKSFLEGLKGKLNEYLDHPRIEQGILIPPQEFQEIPGADKEAFEEMGKQSMEGMAVYDSESHSREAEDANKNIFSFLKSLFAVLADTAKDGMEKVYIVEYTMDKYTYVTSKTERDHFFEKGEVEFILWGDTNQLANITKTMGSIGFLRFSINSIDYFATSKVIHPVVRLVYATGRGLIQSFVDLKELYQGKPISICPSLKGKDMFKVTYSDHLRVFLLMQSAVNEQVQLNNMRQLIQVNIKQEAPGFKLGNCNTVLHGKTEVSINLWFLPLVQVDKLGFKNFEGGRYRIVKEAYMGY